IWFNLTKACTCRRLRFAGLCSDGRQLEFRRGRINSRLLLPEHSTVIVVRYAGDNVLGFQYRAEADRFLEEFRERLGKFGLELNPDKMRRIEFGRFAEQDR
ncbi:MAG: hypothetical protein ACP5RC_12910, partial [Halothiobacillaceae bacterium]